VTSPALVRGITLARGLPNRARGAPPRRSRGAHGRRPLGPRELSPREPSPRVHGPRGPGRRPHGRRVPGRRAYGPKAPDLGRGHRRSGGRRSGGRIRRYPRGPGRSGKLPRPKRASRHRRPGTARIARRLATPRGSEWRPARLQTPGQPTLARGGPAWWGPRDQRHEFRHLTARCSATWLRLSALAAVRRSARPSKIAKRAAMLVVLALARPATYCQARRGRASCRSAAIRSALRRRARR